MNISLKDPAKVKEIVLEKMSLAEVMLAYDVQFAYDPRNAPEVQFKCPFHGKDNKPSARLYASTKSCFCWVCRKSWNVVSFIMDKEHLRYIEALRYIVDRWRIDVSAIPDAPVLDKVKISGLPEADKLSDQLYRRLIELRGKLSADKYLVLSQVLLSRIYAGSCGTDILESLKKIEGKVASCLPQARL